MHIILTFSLCFKSERNDNESSNNTVVTKYILKLSCGMLQSMHFELINVHSCPVLNYISI